MSSAAIPSFVIGLGALSGILDKAQSHAEARRFDPAVLLDTRLFPDMFPLRRQVQIACDLASHGGARLAGIEPPTHEDAENTVAQLKARIANTLVFVKTLEPAKIDGAADREITFPLGPENTGHMRGADYLNHFVLPNFYFHLATAYGILRHCGVELGKRDFMAGIPIRITGPHTAS